MLSMSTYSISGPISRRCMICRKKIAEYYENHKETSSFSDIITIHLFYKHTGDQFTFTIGPQWVNPRKLTPMKF